MIRRKRGGDREQLIGESLESKIRAEFGIPVVAASRAYLSTATVFWPVVAGVLGGAFLYFTFDIGSQALLQGLGAGLGSLVGFLLADRMARADSSQPGGWDVVLALTDKELVVFDRSLWKQETTGVAKRVALDEVRSVTVDKRWFTMHAVFELSDGARWKYVVHRWGDLEAALPEELA